MPEPHASQLQRARSDAGDPLAELIPPHITILGPTVIDDAVMDEVREHLAQAAAQSEPFAIRLRGTATFRPVSPVVFVQVVEGIAGCERLERTVRSGPLTADLRFHYHPHVTIAHHVDDQGLDQAYEAMADFDARFVVSAISLYEHGADEVWRPREEFCLGHGSGPSSTRDPGPTHDRAK